MVPTPPGIVLSTEHTGNHLCAGEGAHRRAPWGGESESDPGDAAARGPAPLLPIPWDSIFSRNMQNHVGVVTAFPSCSKIGCCLRDIVCAERPKEWAFLTHKALLVAQRAGFQRS